LQPIYDWLATKQQQPFAFQIECWDKYLNGESGLLNAPTGSGKTYAIWLGCLAEALKEQLVSPRKTGLKILWITPLRALAADLQRAMQEAAQGMGVNWEIALRTGDTSAADKKKQAKNVPQCLITTPESLHLLLSQKDYSVFFTHLKAVVIDEWHDLIGNKRGVQVSLALSRLRALRPELKTWAISATIGNLSEAAEVLFGDTPYSIVKANLKKQIEVESILPDQIEKYTWAGHLGITLIDKVLPIIKKSKATLLFTNTRSQTEIWYQKLLEHAPDLAGQIAMHHSAIDSETRTWVESALHAGNLKVVICTSSLDLGVDFRPVETVIQVGSPKGVARFLQRAGRSGHRPNAVSRIYFLPTHSLELIEAAALREAIKRQYEPETDNISAIETKIPVTKAFDVLVQYAVTLAVSEGFYGEKLFEEIKKTHAFKDITHLEWQKILTLITKGGDSLSAYDEYKRVENEGDFYFVKSKKTILKHRLSIGTIVSEPLIKVQFVSGGYIGKIEEFVASQFETGDVFFFAGRNLEFVRIIDMTVQVKLSKKKNGKIINWLGGRLPLSSELSALIREQLSIAPVHPEMIAMQPLLALQAKLSALPTQNELLIEYFQTKEGYHAVFYPFEGRQVNEVLAALVAYRISILQPITFTIAINDYGFELLSDQPIPLHDALETDLFRNKYLHQDLVQSINNTEIAKRRFRDIAIISGLLFQGYPGKPQKFRHLQASSQLLFQVFSDYEPDNLLISQAYREATQLLHEGTRLHEAISKIQQQKIILKNTIQPTPFAFPIITERMRNTISSEKVEDRIQKMQLILTANTANE
jgi:ATP-dependent Lhr-like helicase